ncbi:hypothetical protein [Cohnella soli]|uniref:Uncharacterized protein n=1 Tax=Cohnella soli TaxID=425005 RepID=A0ABW0HY89_9BACL
MKIPSHSPLIGLNQGLKPKGLNVRDIHLLPGIPDEQERTRIRVQSLRDKHQLGKPLTDAELEELKTLDPDLYRKASQAEQERRSYEQSLRTCRTRSEASSLHNQRLALLANNRRTGDSEENLVRFRVMQNTYETFRRSPDYDLLERE